MISYHGLCTLKYFEQTTLKVCLEDVLSWSAFTQPLIEDLPTNFTKYVKGTQYYHVWFKGTKHDQ